MISLLTYNNIVLPDVNRFFGFFCGIMLSKFFDSEKLKDIFKNQIAILLIPSLLFLSLLQWNFEWGRLHKPIYFMLVDFIFFIVIANLFINYSILNTLLTNKFIRIIGAISYSLYLCHCICLEIIKSYTFGLFGINLLFLQFVLSFLMTVILSSVLFVLFERPYFTNNFGSKRKFERKHYENIAINSTKIGV